MDEIHFFEAKYLEIKPDDGLSLIVDVFWRLSNPTDQAREIIILPDGRIDILFTAGDQGMTTLHGLGLSAEKAELAPFSTMFGVSFKFLAVECLFSQFKPLAPNKVLQLPSDFFPQVIDCSNLEKFKDLASRKILENLVPASDERIMRLAEFLFEMGDELSIKQLTENLGISGRQLNRYFQSYLGISLKTYLSILRFRRSFGQLKAGKFFPEQHYCDQSHFIRQIKKYAGVIPKELHKNENDRFIQFSTL